MGAEGVQEVSRKADFEAVSRGCEAGFVTFVAVYKDVLSTRQYWI